MRLINEVPVLTRLLDAVKAVPPGQRLHIPGLRDALVNQADVLDGLQLLIAAGEIDRNTLRPPGKLEYIEPPREAAPSIAVEAKPTGRVLAELLDAYAAEHGLSLARIGDHLFSGKSAIARLRDRVSVQQRTVDRVRSFVAGPPPIELAAQAAGGPRVADVGGVTGAGLAAELDAVIASDGLSKSAVGLHLFNNRSGVEHLRQANPRRKTVAKIRAFLAKPPLEELRAKTPAAAPPDCGRGGVAEAKAPPPPPQPGDRRPTSIEVAEQLVAEGQRRGFKPTCVSQAVFGSNSKLFDMRRKAAGVSDKTLAKVTAWLLGPSGDAPAVDTPTIPPPPASQPFERQAPPSAVGQALKSQAVKRSNTTRAERLIEREAAGEKLANVSPMVRAAANDIRSKREAETRQTDPVEAAKLTLQRKGHRVFSAVVSEGPKGEGFFYVGQQRVNQVKLLELAAKASESDPLPTYLKPAEMAWCNQCEQRCSGARAAKCTTPFCKLKASNAPSVGFADQRRQA